MRIVLFLLKSMNQEVRTFGHNFWLWFNYSFSSNAPESLKKSRFHVILDADENDRLMMESLGGKDAERFALLSHDEECAENSQCYRVYQLEALTSILEAIGKLAYGETWVWVARPSLLPSLYDKNSFLGDRLYKIKRDHLFQQIMKDIKKISVRYDLNVVLVDNRELIGNKNSALVERLFM